MNLCGSFQASTAINLNASVVRLSRLSDRFLVAIHLKRVSSGTFPHFTTNQPISLGDPLSGNPLTKVCRLPSLRQKNNTSLFNCYYLLYLRRNYSYVNSWRLKVVSLHRFMHAIKKTKQKTSCFNYNIAVYFTASVVLLPKTTFKNI